MNLSRRELFVLCAIVEIYVRTGEPVASRQVSSVESITLSPATVRGVVAHLEAAGLVSRAHASAGCLPTDRGLRLYVDHVNLRRSLPATVRRQVLDAVDASRRELFEDFGWVAKLAAEVSSEVGMAVRPIGEHPSLVALSIAGVDARRALGIAVTSDGAVEKRLIELPEDVDELRLQEVENRLNHRFRGRSMDVIRSDLGDCTVAVEDDAPAVERLAREVARRMFEAADDTVEVLVAGTENVLMSSDFSEVDRMRSLLKALENHGRIAREWRRGFSRARTHVIIGDESDVTASGRLAMVASLFFCEGRRAGAVGVVGPRRMDYGRLVPMIEYLGDTLTRMLDRRGATHA